MNNQITVKNNIGNTITISNDMVLNVLTYLSDNYAPGSTVLNVDNGLDFTANSIILLEGIGQERAEFKNLSSFTATTLTVNATTFSHNLGTSVYISQYDQIVIEKASSLNGSYSTLGTYLIQCTQQNTVVQDVAGTSTTYYRFKLKNSLSGLESALSVSVAPLVFGNSTIASMIETVRTQVGVSESDPVITTTFLLGAINEAREYMKDTMAGFKQGWLSKFEHPIQLLAGWNFVKLPDDYDYNFTNNALLAVRYPRIGGLAPYPVQYIDKREWNSAAYSLKYTYVVGNVISGATTITVNDIGDFTPAPTGTIFIATNNFNQKILQVNYTGVDLNTNTFTGCTGITRGIDDGTQIFAFPTFSVPAYYTVYEGKIVFNRPIPDIMQARNVYIDYYKAMESITDINQTLDEPFKNIYRFYLRFAIKYRRDNTIKQEDDPDYKMFAGLVKQWIDNHYIGQTQKVIIR